jgi:hypothetical protein
MPLRYPFAPAAVGCPCTCINDPKIIDNDISTAKKHLIIILWIAYAAPTGLRRSFIGLLNYQAKLLYLA